MELFSIVMFVTVAVLLVIVLMFLVGVFSEDEGLKDRLATVVAKLIGVVIFVFLIGVFLASNSILFVP